MLIEISIFNVDQKDKHRYFCDQGEKLCKRRAINTIKGSFQEMVVFFFF